MAIRLTAIELHDWRCHATLTLSPIGEPWVLLAGDNGAGKTSVMEAIYVAVRGRSFRTRDLGDLIRAGSQTARVFLEGTDTVRHALGFSVGGGVTESHLDGFAGASVARRAAAVPVEFISGEAYRLIAGAPAARRSFLDWILFHVEPGFLSLWQNWYRAHRQRNVLLKAGASPREIEPWTVAVAEHGELLSRLRAGVIEQLNKAILGITGVPGLGVPALRFTVGWRATSLIEGLLASVERERRRGRAVVGPQHDDWAISIGGLGATRLSRGQAKLVSVILYRAQVELLARAERVPVLLVDDLAADLDTHAFRLSLQILNDAGGQVWLSVLGRDGGVELPGDAARFHVKHGSAAQI